MFDTKEKNGRTCKHVFGWYIIPCQLFLNATLVDINGNKNIIHNYYEPIDWSNIFYNISVIS